MVVVVVMLIVPEMNIDVDPVSVSRPVHPWMVSVIVAMASVVGIGCVFSEEPFSDERGSDPKQDHSDGHDGEP